MFKRDRNQRGFTIPEVIVAGMILTILGAGTIQTLTLAVRHNARNNLRMQALSVLQKKIELYRSYKFVPVGTNALLNEGTHTLGTETSADGTVFTSTATVVNLPSGTSDAACTFKRITIEAYPQNSVYISNTALNTRVTLERVRGN